MEEREYLVILYDFYGELLSEDNKKYFEDYYFDNLSLAEIAENNNISRNAVHKHIKVCESKLNFYEEKLSLFKKEKQLKNLIKDIEDNLLKEKLEKILFN